MQFRGWLVEYTHNSPYGEWEAISDCGEILNASNYSGICNAIKYAD